jgi:hypothetical protein
MKPLAESEDANDSRYPAAPDRGLKKVTLGDATGLDAPPNAAHSTRRCQQLRQVIVACSICSEWRGAVRCGRPVVMGLKASEGFPLPIRAVDSRVRVRRGRHEGDLQQFACFSDFKLDSQPPPVWLPAPRMRFHTATETLVKYLTPEVQVRRIGLSENWLRGLKLVLRR